MAVMPAGHGRLRPENCWEFKVSLSYRVSLGQPMVQSETPSQKQIN